MGTQIGARKRVGTQKDAFVVAHSFDCLPGHVSISAHGYGSKTRVAVARAIDKILSNERLKHKQISDFKIAIVVCESKIARHGDERKPESEVRA